MVVVYNSVVYPVGVLLWLRRIFSFRGLFHRLCAASAIDSASLARARRRLIHLPWFAAAICGVAGFCAFLSLLARFCKFKIHLIRGCSGICRFHSAFPASSQSHIHFFWSNWPVTGDCFPFSFGGSVPISPRASSRFRCAAAESCGPFPDRKSVV